MNVRVNSETRSTESILSAELGSGERLLWSGRPRGGLRLRPQDAVLIPISLLWGGFAIFWEVMALTMTAKAPMPIRLVFPLFGLPFVAMGLYLMVGRFFVEARVRSRTVYGVTNRRILIVDAGRSWATRSFSLRSFSDLGLRVKPDGSGTVVFGGLPPPPTVGPFGIGVRQRRSAPPAFECVDRVREVHEVICSAQQSLLTAAA